ncbi:GntR family transcriptional regulator [Nonomuraea sp. NBC_00507]|uniref:GntR family transcriptional regulator n=1 Tax=Nonomuraea sp. NBC_00507 TaxID=2976002 RepID=UPI002E19A8EB
MLDREGDTHLYLQISEIIRSRIVAGLSPGDPVISEAEIQREFGVARTTARRAMRVLRNEGLIHTRQGKGSFVGAPGEAEPRERRMPLYRHISEEVRLRIVAGELAPSRPLPSESGADATARHRTGNRTASDCLAPGSRVDLHRFPPR